MPGVAGCGGRRSFRGVMREEEGRGDREGRGVEVVVGR